MVPCSYERVRKVLRTGDILLCSGTSVSSRLIRAGTKSDFTHAGFIVRNEVIDRIFVHESIEAKGVRTVTMRSYVNDYSGSGRGYPGRVMIARHARFAEIADEIKLAQFGADHLSYAYDLSEMFRIFIRILAAKFGYLRDVLERNREYTCAEFLFDSFHAAGVSYSHDSRGFILPCDIPKDKDTFPLAVVKIEN
ncbi:MAG: hypothetical protein UY04_C0011G0016 [Parcubacteria group bacterium GW2011_GWA2_47_7]|nr:MAG: hypothetical protein UY04_C0011G0016 [Parcubacteria group bacterium GW2011_GWA2_47_7]